MKQKTVLLLDDSRIVLDTLESVLSSKNFVVRTAETLADLDAILANEKPDIFVLDVQMPEAFGDDIGQVLRIMRKLSAPILLFSAVDEKELARRAEEAGLDGWVSKNAGVGALVERIEGLLGGA